MISTSVSGEGAQRARRWHPHPARPARIRHANLDDLAFGEQRHRAAVRDQRLPVEAALDDVQLALGEPLRARRGANGIRGFVDEQRLVPGHEVDRLELTGQAGSEVVAGNLHFGGAGGCRSTRHGKNFDERSNTRAKAIVGAPG